MRRYFGLILAIALILPVVIIPGAAINSQRFKAEPGYAFSLLTGGAYAGSYFGINGEQEGTAPTVSRAVGFAESVAARNLPQGKPEPIKDASIKLENGGGRLRTRK